MRDELTELRARCERLELLRQAGEVMHTSLDPSQALPLLLREAVRVTRAGSGSIALVNPNSRLLEIEAAIGLPAGAASFRLRIGQGITGWVAKHGRPARSGDVRSDPRYVTVRPEVRSELAVPLVVDGEVRGALNVDSDRPDAFTADDEALLDALAQQAAVVIRNTWLYEQSRLKAHLLSALVSVASLINRALSLDELLPIITREACQLMRAKLCSVLMTGRDPEWLELLACHGAGPDYLQRPRLSVAESLVGTVVRRRRPVQVEDVRSSRLYQSTEIARREGLVSLLSVPLIFRDRAQGVLNVYTGEPHNFSNEEIRTFAALADLSAIAIERARLAERTAQVEAHLRQSEKLSALGLLAAEVAHEIRNPLTVMKLLFHSMDLRFPDGDPRGEDARIIGGKMDQLNHIVERVLDFARHAEPQPAPVALADLLEDLRLLTRHKLGQHGVRMVIALEPDAPSPLGDPAQLEQAFLNLILNAVEAMPDGGTLTINVRRARGARHGGAGDGVEIVFRDTGTGMPAELQAGAFQPLLNSTKPGGTGLGLAIVNRVIETHRGTLRIASRAGRGTRITVTLPAA